MLLVNTKQSDPRYKPPGWQHGSWSAGNPFLHGQPCSAAASAHREIWGAAPSTAHCNMPPCQRKNQGVLTYSAVSHKDRLDRWHQNVRSVSDSFINLLQTLVDFERNHIDSTRDCTVAFICKISMARGSAYLPANCPDWKAFSSLGCLRGSENTVVSSNYFLWLEVH